MVQCLMCGLPNFTLQALGAVLGSIRELLQDIELKPPGFHVKLYFGSFMPVFALTLSSLFISKRLLVISKRTNWHLAAVFSGFKPSNGSKTSSLQRRVGENTSKMWFKWQMKVSAVP